MKNISWLVVPVLVVLVIVAYMFRVQLRTTFMGGNAYHYSPTPTEAPNPADTRRPLPVLSKDLVITKNNAKKGDYLAGPTGMTLYSFDKDTAGVSNCKGNCTDLWPPYMTAITPAKLPAKITTLTRESGTIQFAYKGIPIYYYMGDKQPGDVTGDGADGVWHLVKP